MKKIILLLTGVLAFALNTSAAPGTPINPDIGYNITLTSSAYDAATDTTTFTYAVVSGRKPSISHWVIAIPVSCGGAEVLVGSNDSTVTWTHADPTTGVRGIKFDTGYSDDEVRTVTLTLAGPWNTGTVDIAVKSGNGYIMGTTQGPVCGGDNPTPTYTLSGLVFFDVNYNGSFNADEIGLAGVTVTLVDANGEVVATTVTAADGTYSFANLPAGECTVVVAGVNGLQPTTLNEHDVTVTAATTVDDTGYGLSFATIGTMSANGYTIGYWKNNLAKALKGTTKGVQVSAATLQTYTTTIGSLALEPFAGLTLASADDILSATGPAPETLLAKQLLASEYNYANGAYLNGDATLTFLFVYYGEYVLKHAADYDSAYVLHVKDWFDAYNNTHGGLILGPTS